MQQSTKDANSVHITNQPVGDIVPDWTTRPNPASNPQYQTLQGQYCRLELLTSATSRNTIEQLYYSFKPTEQTHFTYLDYGPFQTIDEFLQFLQTLQEPSSNTVVYIIIVNEIAVGFNTYLRIDQNNGALEIGHVNFSQHLARTRAATEVNFLLMQYAFDVLGYRRVVWSCNPLNKKSYRASLRLGFQYEGTWIKFGVCKGHSADMTWFSIVDDEWLAVKNELQRWLHPTNFDSNGQQLTKLNSAQANPRSSKNLAPSDGKQLYV